MKKNILLPFMSILIIGYWFLQGREVEHIPGSLFGVTGEEVSIPETQEEDGMVYDVSIEALSKQDFVGENLKLGQILADNEVYTRYYITYESNGLTISGIMNIPKPSSSAGTGDGPFPVLLLNHGYIDPAVYTNGRGLKREQDYLARRGYVVLHSDYRNHAASDSVEGVDESLRLGYAIDVVNAANAVRNSSLPYFDRSNIGMLGHSMGGGVALQIMTALPETAKAYVLFAPVSADARDNFDKWIRGNREAADTILTTYGDFEENSAFWNGISPIHYFDRITAPVMYHHGTQDESVPLEWSERAAAAMEDSEVDVTLYAYEGEPHEFIDDWPLVMSRTVDFFDKNLKP